MWRCHLFDYSTYIPFCVHWHGGLCLRLLIPNYAVVFRLNLLNCGLCCPGWPPGKTERKQKKDKYPNLARELKKLGNMKMMVIPIVIRALGTVTRGLVHRLKDLEIRGQVETIQTTALLRSARILRKVLETWDLLSLKLQ